jgi:hypothetical protein
LVSRIGLAALLWFSCASALAQFQPSSLPGMIAGKHPERTSLHGSLASAIPEDATGYVGNEVCASCHAAIYQSYTRTPMARASGPAIENVVPADFFHSSSGVHYRVYSDSPRTASCLNRR